MLLRSSTPLSTVATQLMGMGNPHYGWSSLRDYCKHAFGNIEDWVSKEGLETAFALLRLQHVSDSKVAPLFLDESIEEFDYWFLYADKVGIDPGVSITDVPPDQATRMYELYAQFLADPHQVPKYAALLESGDLLTRLNIAVHAPGEEIFPLVGAAVLSGCMNDRHRHVAYRT